jgi:NADH-quinone oxidoreductase subunit N
MPELLSHFSRSAASFWPEFALAGTFIAAMVLEFSLRRRTRAVPLLVLAGLAVALCTLPFVPKEPALLFGGLAVADPFALFFKAVVIAAAIVIVLFSMQSAELRREAAHTGEYYCFIAAATLGMTLMAGANNLLMIYLAIEVVSITSYILAGFTRSQARSSEAALKYVLFGALSSGIMLYGMSLLYGMTGSMDLLRIRQMLTLSIYSHAITGWSLAALLASTVMILAGFGYKISAVPFHFWTPDVYEGAPITITAYLAVASKAAGFAVLIRFFYVAFSQTMPGLAVWNPLPGVEWNTVVAALSVLTMTIGNLVAVWQDNLKRMLAYSSIAHAGYMLMGIVVMSSNGVAAVLFYLLMYFVMNLGAFYAVMLIADRIGSEHIDDYRGLGKRAPVVGVALSIFLISLTGLPPTAGFVGKLFLFSAVLDSPAFIWLAIVGVVNSVISLYYYARVLRNMYLREAPEGARDPIAFSKPAIAGLILFVIPNIVFCLYFQPLLRFAQQSASLFLR